MIFIVMMIHILPKRRWTYIHSLPIQIMFSHIADHQSLGPIGHHIHKITDNTVGEHHHQHQQKHTGILGTCIEE